MQLRRPYLFAATVSLCAFMSGGVVAQTGEAMHCIDPVPKIESHGSTAFLKNICDRHVAVIHGFNKKTDGTPLDNPWCVGDGFGRAHDPGRIGDIYDPGEKKPVGLWFDRGITFTMHWRACFVDTRANNSVYFLMQSPLFRFDSDCEVTCE